MEIEIGWKLMVASAWLGLCAIAIVKSLYGDNTTSDIKTVYGQEKTDR